MIPLGELKTALKVADPDDTSEDDFLESCEAAAVAFLERATGRYFGPTAAAAEFVAEGNGTPVLWLPERVSAVSGVTERLYMGETGTAILTGDTDGWALRLAPGQTHGNQVVRKGGSVWSRWREYVVTGSLGYPAGVEPADIRQAVLQLATLYYEERLPIGEETAEVPFSVRDVINHHRRIAV